VYTRAFCSCKNPPQSLPQGCFIFGFLFLQLLHAAIPCNNCKKSKKSNHQKNSKSNHQKFKKAIIKKSYMLMSILSTLSGRNPPQWMPEGCTDSQTTLS
jgi:hypothetical protein